MDPETFAPGLPGTLVVPIRGHDPRYGEDYETVAYLPEPLPARPALAPETYRAVSEASAAVARLDQASIQLPNPGLLARPSIRREAVSTSALEGTYATFGDVLVADAVGVPQSGGKVRAVAEVVNYVQAAEYAFEWVSGRPITIGLLEGLHKILVSGTPADNADAGRLRTIQVFIGAHGGRVESARFVPPPPGDQLRAAVEEWHRYITADQGELTIVEMALGHYQFETLHPFNDGNGRLGRLVCVLQLAARGELRTPVLNLSPWLETHKGDYQRLLFDISATGDFDPWVRFFSEAVRVQATATVQRIEALATWRRRMQERLSGLRVRGMANQIMDDMIGYPMVTAAAVAQRYGISFPAASEALRKLETAGIVSLRSGHTRPRIYQCDPVIRILEP